jgi:hypothetical protein
MSSQGPLGPSGGADATGIGTVAWSNPSRITAEDASNATVTLINQTSHWLEGTGFGFSIPAGATINGILVEWKKADANAGGTIFDAAIRLIQGGTVQSTDRSSGSAWPLSNSYVSYGGSADLWGGTWAYSDINASNFGAALAAREPTGTGDTAQVDYVRITVYYTSAAGTFAQVRKRKAVKRQPLRRRFRIPLFAAALLFAFPRKKRKPKYPLRRRAWPSRLLIPILPSPAPALIIIEQLQANLTIIEQLSASALAADRLSASAATAEALSASTLTTESLIATARVVECL